MSKTSCHSDKAGRRMDYRALEPGWMVDRICQARNANEELGNDSSSEEMAGMLGKSVTRANA